MRNERRKTGKHGRLSLAVGLSLVVVLASALNIVVTDRNPLTIGLQDFGQWLSGIAGALAFIWLIVSYFQQGEELELQREELAATREQLALQKAEMARLADEAGRQAKSIEATELHARRDTFMRLFELGQAIQATLLRGLDAKLFGSAAESGAGRSGRDLYLEFADILDSHLLLRPATDRLVFVQDTDLIIRVWPENRARPADVAGYDYYCKLAEVKQLLWFDEMLMKEATFADPTGGLAKFVEALPSQKSIERLEQLLSEVTDTADGRLV